jgi:DNA replication protein DnaC
VLDELGYIPCDSRAADLLFHIISRRHEARSVVITGSDPSKARRIDRAVQASRL